jgi:hypothetical protein
LIAGVFIFLVYVTIYTAPELKIVEQLTEENRSVTNEFGKLVTIAVEDLPGTEKKVSAANFTEPGSTYGTYFFRITGEKGSGTLKVDWQQQPDKTILLSRITIMNDNTSGSRVIWDK